MINLPDPIGGKGYANILSPINIPKFDNIAAMQADNDKFALNAAKLAADQRAKAAELAQKQAQLDAKAKDNAAKEKAKTDANMWLLLKDNDAPLIGDAQHWAAIEHQKLVDMGSDIQRRGIDLNGFSPEVQQFRRDIDKYHVNYKRHSDVAKGMIEKQKLYNSNVNGFNQYDMSEDVGKYSGTGAWDKDYYLSNLSPIIEDMSEEDRAKRDNILLGDVGTNTEVANKGKRINSTTTKFDETTSSIARNTDSFIAAGKAIEEEIANGKETPDMMSWYNPMKREAKQLGFTDAHGNIDWVGYGQKREKLLSDAPKVKDIMIHNAVPPKAPNSNNYTWSGNGFTNGKINITHTGNHIGGLKEGEYIPIAGSVSLPNTFSMDDVPVSSIIDITNGRAKNISQEQLNRSGISGAQQGVVHYLPIDKNGLPKYTSSKEGVGYQPLTTSENYKAFLSVNSQVAKRGDDNKKIVTGKDEDGNPVYEMINKNYLVPLDATKLKDEAPNYLNNQDADKLHDAKYGITPSKGYKQEQTPSMKGESFK